MKVWQVQCERVRCSVRAIEGRVQCRSDRGRGIDVMRLRKREGRNVREGSYSESGRCCVWGSWGAVLGQNWEVQLQQEGDMEMER